MLDSGYSLSRVEVVNWGNFYGYQKFQLKDIRGDGLLFSPPASSAILGINGSGKSTLIDGIMITMLPFENSLKLGVTNDMEAGSGGGRTIKDYVLGKHSSTHSNIGTHIQSGYGRKEGCSVFMLVFQHNRNVNKFITLGRIWWYQNYQVSDTHLAFIGYDPLSVDQIFFQNESPKNPKVFKSHMKEQFPHVQIYDVMQNYFSALSSSFGHISKEDLKILNRAFYVKSISQIDQFIRENMLLEQDSPHLDRLLENVRNGKEIAHAIQTCEKKIDLIEKILRNVTKLENHVSKRKDMDQQLQLCSYYEKWDAIEVQKANLQELRKEVETLDSQLPSLQSQVLDAEKNHKYLQTQLAQNDLESRLQKIELEAQYLTQELSRLETEMESRWRDAKSLGLNFPSAKKEKDLEAFHKKLPELLTAMETDSMQIASDLEALRRQKYELEIKSEDLKQELQHLAETKSLIPQDLYSIKMAASEKLKTPRNHIVFVGELIQVKKDYLVNRKAIESVLFPISRNILIHPDYLNAMTQWLDQTGLKSDVVVKRIAPTEISDKNYDASIFEASMHDDFQNDSDQILHMIDILPDKEHPFGNYLKTWLADVFDYQLVDYKTFKNHSGKLVTAEGLVKTDARTMRKLKMNFHQSLGWDNQDVLAQKTKEMVALHEHYLQMKKNIEDLSSSHQLCEQKKYFLKETASRFPLYREFPVKTEKLQSVIGLKQQLLKENPDYEDLKKEEARLYKSIKELQKKESQISSQIEIKKSQIDKWIYLIPDEEKKLQSSSLHANLLGLLSTEKDLFEKLRELKSHLSDKNIYLLNYEDDIKTNLAQLENQMEMIKNHVIESLNTYRNQFEEPNLPFTLPPSAQVSLFADEWKKNLRKLEDTELPKAQDNWKKFFDQILIDSVKDMINEIKSKLYDVEQNINSINDVLKLTNFEDLTTEKRYLKIYFHFSVDERIKRFRRSIQDIEKLLGVQIRHQIENQSENVMKVLLPFVEEFQSDLNFRNFVIDVRNHFHFEVHSLRRAGPGDSEDQLVEVFSGAKKDAKSSAQTTHLAYTLLASCLAYRFKFNDPHAGQETPRLLILDEFGGKFDNEKPKDIIKLLDKMGFQSILVSPMSKADLLAGSINHLVFVHKVSSTHSKVRSVACTTKEDYENLLRSQGRVTGLGAQ